MKRRWGNDTGANGTILIEKCPCGRIRVKRDWKHPTMENGMVQQITENYHRIIFIEGKCPACKVQVGS